MDYLKDLTPFIKTLCSASGKIIKKYYRSRDLSIENKEDTSPVTIADKGAEEIMRNLIQKEFPDHGILGEEFGETKPQAEYKWVLDPIDGTKSFISGTPLFGTLIALVKDGSPVIGAIHQPVLDDFTIGDNRTTLINDSRVKMRSNNNLNNAVVITTDTRDIISNYDAEKYLSYLNKIKFLRTWGDAYGYFLLASGYADIMLDPVMNPWDIMAVIPVIKGAGGVITDWQGNPAEKGTSIIAAGPELHRLSVTLLN